MGVGIIYPPDAHPTPCRASSMVSFMRAGAAKGVSASTAFAARHISLRALTQVGHDLGLFVRSRWSTYPGKFPVQHINSVQAILSRSTHMQSAALLSVAVAVVVVLSTPGPAGAVTLDTGFTLEWTKTAAGSFEFTAAYTGRKW
jgi:hypothetical protein